MGLPSFGIMTTRSWSKTLPPCRGLKGLRCSTSLEEIDRLSKLQRVNYPTNDRSRSTRCIAFSNRSKRFRFSTSRRSSTATRSSSFARSLRSCATISLAWMNNCAVNSSSSVLAWVNWFSAALRKFCSRLSAFCRCLVSSGSGPTCALLLLLLLLLLRTEVS